jgi:uncharacterized protein (DUF1800 family)
MSVDLQRDRLLGRATFGPRPGGLGHIASLEPEAWLARQLHPAGIDESALHARLASAPALALRTLPDMAMRGEFAELGPNDKKALKRGLRAQAKALAGRRLVRAAHAERQLEEVMVDFWLNHFNVYARKGPVAMLVPAYEETIRRYALGRFEDLLVGVARSPAMLFYLDNVWSTRVLPARRGIGGRRLLGRGKNEGGDDRERGGLNENYARELLELHTLGVHGGYTQKDVTESARVLTGWSMTRESGAYRFRDRAHDPGAKRVLGQRVPGAGEDEGLWLLRALARHPSTARQVSMKLARRFVADEPPARLIERASARFLETEGDIRAVLRVILLAPELSEPGQRKLKTPLELVASALRHAGAETDGGKGVLFVLNLLGELPCFCPSPTGYPDRAADWLDPGAMLERMSFAYGLAGDRIPGVQMPSNRSLRERVALARSLAAPEFQWQ